MNLGIAPEVIRDGKKIYLISVPDLQIKFIPINNYLKGDEYELAKQFNIKFDKHFFPQKLNFPANYDYIGAVPPKTDFFTFTDSESTILEKEIFVQNYIDQKYKWDFKKELFRHIDEKLFLLTMASLKFLKDCFTLQSLLHNSERKPYIHPFGTNICTIAGFSYKVYKFLYLNSFPIFTIHNEFGNNGKEISAQEAEWSAFMDFKHPDQKFRSSLYHPKGQKYFAAAIPDLYSPISKTAYFYCGCFWHGHYDNCLLNPNANESTLNTVNKKTYLQLNNELNKKIRLLLENHPNEISSITIQWECDYLKKRESLSDLKNFLTNQYKLGPLFRLCPRSAVRGAYFDNYAMRWLKTENPEEKFYALDLNGMYSFIAIKNRFMIGPYKILVGDLLKNIKFTNNKYFYDDKEMFGVMLVTILPPKNSFFPYLMYRLQNGSTVNCLCAKCAESSKISKCNHSDKERALTGSYFISEINFALTLGYEVISIHECHFFESADFILKDFVQTINCLKIQNSNCLQACKTIEEKKLYCAYLNDMMELKEPFKLQPKNIKDNESAKQFYKLIANSLFGKFQQKANRTKTKFFTSQTELENVYFSKDIIKQINCINENICQVEIEPDQCKQSPNRETNCYIGGQLTAYARQYIYEQIQAVSQVGKVYYCDCDCIYFSANIDKTIPLIISDALGHFKNVYPGEILKFYTFGTKSYVISYKTENDKIKEITKVKGFSISTHLLKNEIDSHTYNFFLDQFLKDEIEKKEIPQLRQKKNVKKFKVDQYLQSSSFSNHISSRRMIAKKCQYLTTFPYGYSEFP
jgi:G:T-mismatch repair DNA endonuclease (very short patch repair protein)